MSEILVILLSVISLMGTIALFLWHHAYKKSMVRASVKTVSNEIPDPDNGVVMLHGHDLSKWNYLGYTRCTYVDEHGNKTGEYPIFLFASKKDMKRRSYHITSEYAEKTHSYMNRNVKPWAAGEGEIYQLIGGEGNSPSDFLKQHMLDTFGAEWDTETKWWGTNDKAKYTAAQNKQKHKRNTPPNQGSGARKDPVVIKVDFGK